MKRFAPISLCILFPLLAFGQKIIQPPVAKMKPVAIMLHGDTLIDNYAWMKNKNSRAMQKYLKAENRYTETMMEDSEDLQKRIYAELIGRLKETDMSIPFRYNGYWYYDRTIEEQNYPLYCRKKDSLENSEEVLLDANTIVREEKCYDAFTDADFISPNNRIMAYAIDKTGNFEIKVLFKDLLTGKKLSDVLTQVTSLAWADDSKTVYYTTGDKITNRSYRLHRHILGTPVESDVLLFEEKNNLYEIRVYSSKSKKYIYLYSESSDESEVRYLPANSLLDTFRLLYPREKNHRYYVTDYQNSFYIATNKDAINYKLVYVTAENPEVENWKELIPDRDDVLLDEVEIFKDYLVISERIAGDDKIRVMRWDTKEEYSFPFEEPAYSLTSGINPDFDTDMFRFYFSSLKNPDSAYEINLKTKEKKLLKQLEIPCGHNPYDYATEKIWAEANDGKKIPISLLYKKSLLKNGSNPVYLEGYGAYGFGIPPEFNNDIFPLVDRGFIYAIAHVRGGDDLGRAWYYEGRMLNKKNTFYDFISCAEHLIKEKYTSAGLVIAQGASAGGLLTGALANMRPDLFKGIILEAPFVDVLNTMLDTLLPLTSLEFTEWGNPYEREFYDYMKSYAPYENIQAMNYPNLLFTSGIADEQVGVWEPAKMVAKLRTVKTDNSLLLFKITFKGGHSGPSGRYHQYEELAFEYAWILKIFGLN